MAVPTIENTTHKAPTTGDYNFNHVATGSGLLAVVTVNIRYGASTGIVGVTYDGNAMTLGKTTASGLGYVFYYTNGGAGVSSGTHNVSVDVLAAAASRPTNAVAWTLEGVDLSSPVDATAEKVSASTNNVQATITTTVADTFVVSSFNSVLGNTPVVAGTGHTGEYLGNHSAGTYGHGYLEAATATGHTLGYTLSNSTNDEGLALIAFAPAGGGGGGNNSGFFALM